MDGQEGPCGRCANNASSKISEVSESRFRIFGKVHPNHKPLRHTSNWYLQRFRNIRKTGKDFSEFFGAAHFSGPKYDRA